MRPEHFEVLVEEPSMEAFLRNVLPSLLGNDVSFEVYPYQGKSDLLGRLEERLRGYAAWLPETWRIVILIDRDDENCITLKQSIQDIATGVGLSTRRSVGGPDWQLVDCIAIEELEAWYFGDWEAVCAAYPRMRANLRGTARYRDCDAIAGGTWEAFERELQRQGHFEGGLRKIEAARTVSQHFSPPRCDSQSFARLRFVLEEALAA